MSERSKGDTSSSVAAPPVSARVVKNPLLSASVTGLTFDDFHNKPLLLPAAPPIIHPVPVVSSREATPLVTVGKSSDIDSENLSEINLNDISGSSTSNPADTSDENSNTLLEPSTQVDNSILSQAASSFSQLPSVASSVFSTFSKKFNSSSKRDDINSNPSPQLDIQPFTTQAPPLLHPPPTAFANKQPEQNTPQQNEPQLPVHPPIFYSPTEVSTIPSGVAHPPLPSCQNTYRISARKKIYAPIPGLSSAHQEHNLPASNTSFLPPIDFDTSPIPVYPDQTVSNQEENKGGLFSLTNLVPGVPSVFQNLSGLVQSAAGSISQKLQEQPQKQHQQQPLENSFAPFQVETVARDTFFSTNQNTSQHSYQTPPPPGNFFAPPVAGAAQPLTQPLVQGAVQSTDNFFTGIPPKSGFVPSNQLSQRPSSRGNVLPGQPPQSTTPTNIPPLIPSAQPPSSAVTFPVQPPQSITPTNIPLLTQAPPRIPSAQPPFTGVLFPGQPPSVAPDLLCVQPPQQLPSGVVQEQFSSKAPPIKPPSGVPASSSFRLQKGTRLYKSPFAAPPSENQPHLVSGYPPGLQSFAPPNQPNFSNPIQQGSLFSQGPPLPFASETVSTSIAAKDPVVFNPLNPATQATFPYLIPGQTDETSSFAGPPLPSAPEKADIFSPANQIQPPSALTHRNSPLLVSEQETVSDTENNTVQERPTAAKETEIITHFNPPQQSSLPSHGLPPSLVHESDITAIAENNSVQEEPNFDALNPVSDAQEHPVSNLLINESKLLVTSPEPELRQPEIPLIEDTKIHLPSEVSSTTNLVNPFEKESRKPDETLNTVEQFNFGQSNQLPPPPAIFAGVGNQSKETANFPPPPPQHSIQSKATSNPYRKGLQSHSSQLPAPPTLSAFFTPNDQDINLFPPIVTQAAVSPPPNSTVFGKASDLATPAIPEAEFSESCSTIEEPDNGAPEVDVHPTSVIFTPLQTSASSPPLSKLSDTTFLPNQIEPVLSFSTSESTTEAKINPLQEDSETTPTPSSNFVSFFKADHEVPGLFPVVASNESKQENSNLDHLVATPPVTSKIASPLESEKNSKSQQTAPNLLTSFFDQTLPSAVTPVINQPSFPDPTSFFDSFGQVPSVGVDSAPPEDPNSQRIQNFFNNPPPKDLDPVGDLNYNLVGSGLSVKNLQTRSLTPASNLAEPPSSSCSDFSELNSSLSAVNRQPRVSAEDSNKVSPEEGVIFEAPDYQDLPEEIINEIKMANTASLEKSGGVIPTNVVYKPAVKHWFYKKKFDTRHVWTPFSYFDSALLEDAFLLGDGAPNLIAVEGGRYDVNISERTKAPIYWEGEPIEVKRCSWFYKASDSKYVPYEEQIADLLEEEYKRASDSCEWHKKIPISAHDTVVFHGPTVIVHFQQQQQVDAWGGSTQTSTRPRVVKRDLDDFTIEDGETHKVDHLLYMVHGIGSACDLKMRSVEEVVEEFRAIALQLVQSHYKNSVENGVVGRVEVLPVSWHGELHSDELGIDEKLKSITLESIPKLRNFTNDTLLDILFYTSPMFCQRIMNTVTASMNSIFIKYKQRNPDFRGGVSLAGHSLGSLILFDLLCHQRPPKDREEGNMENPDEITPGYPVDSNQLNEDAAKHISYKMGPAGTGQPFISYPQLVFQPKQFFALGSPIGMFVTIRGIDKLGLEFRLPTCPGFYNIFHPYDPVAYRLEALVNPDMNGIPPVLIPHHKGRKRMHLELKETMSRVGADLKQRFFETFKTTFDSVGFLKHKNDPKEMEKEVEKVLEQQTHQDQQTYQGPSTSRSRADSNSTNQSDTDIIEVDFPLGKLNVSKRVDYVLQEAPLEFFNEYLFALSSHVCYWESEDTILFVMKEIYNGIGISTDSQVPQQTMTIERPCSRGSAPQSPTS